MSRRGRGAPPISLFSFQDIITSVTGIMVLVTLCLGLELMQRKAVAPPEVTSRVTSQLAATAAEAEQLRKKLDESQKQIKLYSEFDAETVRRELAEMNAVNNRLVREVSDSERQREQVERQKALAKNEQARRATDPQSLAELRRQIADRQQRLEHLKRSNQVVFNRPEGEAKSPWLVQVGPGGLLAAEAGRRAAPQSFPGTAEFRSWLVGRQRNAEYFVLLIQPEGVARFGEVYQALLDLQFDVGLDLLTPGQTAIDLQTGAVPR